MIRLDVSDGVAAVTIDVPPVNALDDPTYESLIDTFAEIARNPDARCVILRAAGTRAFCAGTNVHFFGVSHPDDNDWHERHSALVRDTFSAILQCPVPVIAAPQAACVGAGIGLIASCDFVIAAEEAVFRLPEIDVGVLGGARHMARLVPAQLMRYLAYSGDTLSARELLAAGGAVRVVPAAELWDVADQIAQRLARKNPVGLRSQKQGVLYNEMNSLNVEAGYRYEQFLTGSIGGHPFSQEAIRAHVEKREPVFVHRAQQ